MKYTLLVGSLRKESLNRKLLSNIDNLLREDNLSQIEIIDSNDIDLPLYNQDIENEGIPSKVKKIVDIILSTDALIVCSPEYNGSISSPLKNTIDWVSRNRPIPFNKLPVLMTGASPGRLGAMRGIAHSKVPFEILGAYVYPETFALPKAHEAFDDEGKLNNQESIERLKLIMIEFSKYCQKLIKE